ncbi:MAG: hypothetical protein U5R06_11110 [candidate division KSB1 bacterium]|nr:hypothetical protein [candidate division KSB1 bacterium]
MKKETSPYVERNRSWIIKNVLSAYLRAANLFEEIYQSFEGSDYQNITFDHLKQLSDILFDAKEQLRLIYKRSSFMKGKPRQFGRYNPDSVEFKVINNIGVLFHKATIARELKYMVEFYQTDSEDYHQIKTSLADYIEKIHFFFNAGKEAMLPFLKKFKDDVIVLSYLLENEHYVKATLEIDIEQLLKFFGSKQGVENYYLKVIDFFLESGWMPRAKKMIKAAYDLNPESEKTGQLFNQYM